MAKLVEIAHFYDPEEAYCAKGYLQSNGVETILQNDHHLTMAPWMRVALGGYRLMATSDDEDAAKEALKNIGAEGIEAAPGDAEPDTQWRRKRNWLWLPIAFGSSAPFLPPLRYDWIGFIQFVALALLYIMLFVAWGFWVFG